MKTPFKKEVKVPTVACGCGTNKTKQTNYCN